MDVLSQKQLTFSQHDVYVEKFNLFRLFQYMLERIIVDRPEDPISYLQLLLLKGFRDVHQVLLLGPPTVHRKIVTSALEMKFRLVHLTRDSLLQHADADIKAQIDAYTNLRQIPAQLWADLTKRRVEKADCIKKGFILEGIPSTREQAFLMLKIGIFPTHIVMVEEMERSRETESYRSMEVCSDQELEETQDFRTESSMIIDLFSRSNMRSFTLGEDLSALIEDVEEFIRDKESSFVPYVPRVLLFGPPGSGKRTMASMLTSKYPLKRINMEEILNQAVMTDGPFKEELQEALSTQGTVTDELLAKVTAAKLKEAAFGENGWILSDFPFNVTQAEITTDLLEGFQANKAIFLEVDLDTSLRRLEPRRLDPQTGETYHLVNNPPPVSVKDRLLQRKDDTREEITELYHSYKAYCVALQGYYSRALPEDIVFYIDANEDNPNSVFEVLETYVLGPPRRKVPASAWWDWPSRNSGIY